MVIPYLCYLNIVGSLSPLDVIPSASDSSPMTTATQVPLIAPLAPTVDVPFLVIDVPLAFSSTMITGTVCNTSEPIYGQDGLEMPQDDIRR